ncbi:hypothetical protein XELAEV_18044202mg [Xenopus laevis]|uniref:Uncharacterized protein n=1 Tax=Xenopus laevis TaxID=8355 RepID=A0A974H3H9_XENLA|nr:hypothetical protein XELAEV_18044202mg [Xenopus laevis]
MKLKGQALRQLLIGDPCRMPVSWGPIVPGNSGAVPRRCQGRDRITLPLSLLCVHRKSQQGTDYLGSGCQDVPHASQNKTTIPITLHHTKF